MSKSTYPLTNPQKSIWLTGEFYKGTSIGNITGNVIISQNVDFDALKKAIHLFVKKNDSFRLKFTTKNDVVEQFVDDFTEFEIEIVSVSSEKDIKNIERQMCDTPFNTLDNFLYNFKLFKFENGHGGFIITAHHLISDAWTAGLVVNEIMAYYEKIVNSQEIDEQNPSYIDYIISEQEYLNSEKFKKDKEFWNEIFKTIPEVATVPSFNDVNSDISCKSKRKQFIIPKETMNLINDFCKENKVSAFNFFMGIFSIYLSRVSSLDDFTIGTPILNRGNFKEKQTTGMYISTVPFRISINKDISFADFLSNISADFSKIFRHQKYPYQYILEDLRKQDSTIPNLYKILLSYQNIRSNKQTSDINYESNWIGNNCISDDIDIHLYDMNDTGDINIAYDYLVSKYNLDDICSIHARILHIINQILKNNEIKINEIEIVTPDEKNKILYDFNNTKADYPKDKTISQLFEEQVGKTPDNIAVKVNNDSITYRELNEKANQLANYLIHKGVSTNDVIAVRIDKRIEMIVSILGIIKAGACYLPINLSYPKDRVQFMISDSNAKLLLCDSITKNDFSIEIENIITDFTNKKIYSLETSNPNLKLSPNNLLYIIYTSGSTGKPKGAMLTNKNIVRLMKNDKFLFDFSEKDVWTMFHSVAFDFSVWEMYGALLYGGTLILVPDSIAKDPTLFLNLLRKENVTVLNQTPTYFYNLLNSELKFQDSDLKIRYIVYGGEALKPNLIRKWKIKYPNTKLINMYGITETTVHVTFKELNELDLAKSNSNIGVPIPTLEVLLLDKNLKMVPFGVPGEICVAGDGVFKGYLNRPDLNESKLIPNPYNPSQILYRSGDSAFRHYDGNLEYVGRIDTQVKIRGFRVELGEIEEKLLEFSNIDSCVVTTKSVENSHDLLCAYYVKNSSINLSVIRTVLQKKLPTYMIPQYFIELDSLPYNHNGKIDKNKLPLPTVTTSNKIVPPRNNIDENLSKILKELLNVTSLSINDSFFELGGDSLTAINLCTKVYSEFNVQILVKDVLENPIIKDLSDLIASKDLVSSKPNIFKVEESNFYPVSSAQARTYYSSSLAGNDSTLYNISGALILDKIPDINKLENAFNKLIKRQPSLRTYFDIEDEKVVQKIESNINFKLDVDSNSINNAQIDDTFNNFVKPFDLAKAPLFRAKLVKLENNKAILMIDMHHIISDGTSLSIIVDNISKFYNNEVLPELKIDYKDYSVWENNNLKNEYFKEAEEYWTNKFKDEVPVLNLPTKPRPAVQSFEGSKVYCSIDSAIVDKLNYISKNLGITPYMILLSAYYVLLSKYTSQEDIVVGTPIVNRDSSELYDVVGMFVNSLPVRATIDSNLKFKEFLNNIKDICLENYKYQNYPFDELVNKLKISRDASRNPLFDTMFIYQNNGYAPVSFDGTNATYYIPDSKISKFDLSLEIVPDNNKLNLSFEYSTKLFDKEFIENLSKHYTNILNIILNNIDIKISDICILSEDEKNKILYEFNNTKADYPKDKTISQLFEEQVEKTPDNIALVFGDNKLTYKELNERANSLAYYLRNNNIGRNDIVGIMVNRSLEMIVSILAVLKSGAAYLPIDPSYPKSRISYLIEDSKVKLILTTKNIMHSFENLSNSILVDLNIDKIYSNHSGNLDIINTPDDLAYLIYTSGSTGKPKGVMLTQSNVNNFIEGTCKLINFEDTIVSVTTMCFDIFVLESLLPLQKGLKVVIANEDEQNISKNLNQLCLKNNVKMLQTTPSRMSLLLSDYNNLDYIRNLSVIMLGGEPFPYKLLQELKYITNSKIYNMYGPTETTVWSSIKDLTCTDNINIGKPILNTQMYILDKSLNILPVGVPGDLYIGGIGVSRGYLGRNKLTSEKFTINTYIKDDIIYNTGDIAKWLPNGEIDCLGRSDSQVKLRGLRIELGEIEKQILSFPNIDNSIVCIKNDTSDRQFLCGYFISKERISVSELKNYLSKFLPSYMIPSFLIQLEDFKYTPNGKVDKNSLPNPKISSDSNIIIAETPTEKMLSKIWEDLLSITPISINESFFNLGGDSILALKMQIELLNYNINISYADIFKYNTIKQLALKIDSMDNFSISYIEQNYNFEKINNILKQNNTTNANKIEKKEIGNVLLTGATGFLGAHILDYLLKNTNLSVYCLIRKDNNNSTSTVNKLINRLHYYFGDVHDNYLNKRLFVITSDITVENLGLNETQLTDLASNISCVINSAAIVKHYGYYSDFEKVNVTGVNNLINFCKMFSKRLIQISTISVSGNTLTDLGIQESNLTKDVYFSENNLYINQPLNNVYVRSKFEAEKLILENIANNSLNALILRVGNITSRYSDGKFQPNANENAFLNRLKAFIELKVIPDYILNDYIEFSPVDNLAESIVRSIEFINSSINVLHLYNNNHVYINKLLTMLPKNLIKVVSEQDFKDVLNKTLQISINKDIISHITNDLDKNKKLIYNSHIKITNEISNIFLKNIKFNWQKIEKDYILNLLNIL